MVHTMISFLYKTVDGKEILLTMIVVHFAERKVVCSSSANFSTVF